MFEASLPDLLRLTAVPVFAWAAVRDVRTRRVPNATWYPLAALGVVLLAWEAHGVWTGAGLPAYRRLFALRVTVSLGVVVPMAYLLWRIGGFGGADAKAFMALAVLFPTYPVYYLPSTALPLVASTLGVFSLTVLTNTVLVGALYPAALGARNLLAGHLSWVALVGVRVAWDDVTDLHGRLLETPGGFTRDGLDLDALRMYLRWRDTSLAALRSNPDLRDPATLPAEPGDPTDGAVATDGGDGVRDSGSGSGSGTDAGRGRAAGSADEHADPWGAEAFLADLDRGAYGTTPDQLRAGLDLLVERDRVWVTPGIPFLVPTLGGLVVALTYGDVLTGLMRLVGLV
ncbi:MAG: prepilin peptidase [Halorientalis sp.]